MSCISMSLNANGRDIGQHSAKPTENVRHQHEPECQRCDIGQQLAELTEKSDISMSPSKLSAVINPAKNGR